MSRNRRRNRPLVAGTEKNLEQFKLHVMKQKGYMTHSDRPDQVKYEVAKEIGVPLQQGYNGNLTSEAAGKVGGKIGGAMVKELIRIAQEKLDSENNL